MKSKTPFDAYVGNDPFIFVSYSHDDSGKVFSDIERLQEEGYRIWYDEGISPGKAWPEEVEKALLKSSIFIVFISPSAISSDNVRNEIFLAIEEGKTILAIHLEKTELDRGLRLQMSSVQALMKFQLSDDVFFRKLSRSLPTEVQDSYREDAEKAASLQFLTHYTNPITPNDWQWMNIYVFFPDAYEDVERDYEAFGKEINPLSSENAKNQTIDDNVDLFSERIELEIETPRIKNSIFNPKKLTFGLYEKWHRFDFKFMIGEEWQNKKFNSAIKVNLKGFPFSEVPISLDIESEVRVIETSRTQSDTYQNIYVSYSRNDSHIVAGMEKAYSILGLNYIRDINLVRSGQEWNQQMRDLIHEADIFQLLWSTSSSRSKYAEQEWRYALSLIQSGEKDSFFIRPIYWEIPMPAPPKELEHLHFAYLELNQ